MSLIRKNDQVRVMAGKDRGKIGKVVRVLNKGRRVIVEKVNLVKRHTRPTQKNPQGGIVEKEMSIHISNIMLMDPKSGQNTRVGVKTLEDGKKVRVSKKSKEVIEVK